MTNVNDTYFDGYYKEIWRNLIPEDFTAKETEFMIRYFDLGPENKVLDIMCGYGRHALGLARKGIPVSAVDNLEDYVQEIQEKALIEKLPLVAEKANIIDYKVKEFVDLAICMGNSICFFDRADTVKLMKMINAHLNIGGSFLINSWSIAEISFSDFQARAWSQMGDLKLVIYSQYFLQPSRIETEHLIISPDGKTEAKHAVDYIYSIAETENMLNEAGFSMEEVYSIPGKKRFTLGDSRAYIIAKKIAAS